MTYDPIISDRMEKELKDKIDKSLLLRSIGVFGFLDESRIYKYITEFPKVEKINMIAAFLAFRKAEELGKHIKVTDPNILVGLLMKGNWLHDSWDIAVVHWIFNSIQGDKDDFFKPALDSVPEFNRLYPSIMRKELSFFFFENYYHDILKTGKKVRLDRLPDRV